MYEELASVKGIVDLSPAGALDEAQSFLTQQGYETVRRTGNSLTVERRLLDQATEQEEASKLTVSALPQPGGGVRIAVRGNDREGVQERQAAWVEWSESLPKKPEAQVDEPGDQKRAIEIPEVPLPPPPRVESQDVPPPPQPPSSVTAPPPRQGPRRLLVGALVGCGTLSVLGVLLVVALVVGVGIGTSGKGGSKAANEGEKTNAPSRQGSDPVEFEPVVLRVSGDQGTSYDCMYNTKDLEEGEVVDYQVRENGTLGPKPVDYAAQIVSEPSDRPPSGATFHARCSIGPTKTAAERGRLKAEVLVNDAVKDEDETRPDPANKTSERSTTVEVNYFQPCDGPLPKDPEKKVEAKVKGKGYC